MNRWFLLSLFFTYSAQSIAQEPWPYPQDTPQSSELKVGLAGETPVDITRFLLARGVSQSSINAQGTHVAFISSATGRNQVWIQGVNDSQAMQVTFGNGVSFYRWHPDGQRLMYGTDKDGNEREAFYLITRNGKKEQLILKRSKAFRRFGAFSPDGNAFTYASTQRNGRDFDIYLHNLNSGKSTMIWQAEFGFYPQAWQPGTANILVTETRGEDAQDVYLLNTQTKSIDRMFAPEVAAAFTNFHWQQDGKAVFFTSNIHREMTAVYRYDVTEESLQALIESKFDLDDLRLCNNGNYLVWTENQMGFDALWVQAMDKNQQAVQIPLPQGVYTVSCASKSPVIAVQISGPRTPGQLYLVNGDTQEIELLHQSTNAGIDNADLVIPQIIEFPAQDGVTLHGLLYLPKSGDKPAPLVIDIHGGPTAQARPSWQPLAQYLVGKGIAVLDINVRGSTGYGKTFARLDNQERRLDSVRDLVDALAYLKDDQRIDTDNAAVMGGSYGGYMVNAVMGKYPQAFKAGASFVGVANWVRALETASPGLKASDRIEYGDIREERWQSFYASNSPINTVGNITAPMFYQHGVNDPRDPVTESDSMVKNLREKGIEVTYLRFPDEGHSLSKLTNRITFYQELAAFLERHLKPSQKQQGK